MGLYDCPFRGSLFGLKMGIILAFFQILRDDVTIEGHVE